MHGAAQWTVINGLINGRTTVLMPKFDPHEVWRAVERYRIPTLGITGDAMGRPLIEALDEGGYDASSLTTVASTAAVFSATVKEQFHERFPNLVIADAVGSTETGYNGVRVIMKGGHEKPGLPTVRMGPDTVVLDDDMNIVEPGSGVVGRMARGGNVPLRYHKDPEKSAATFVTVNGRRYSISGDSAIVEADGTMTLLGRGSVCINSGGEKIYPEEVEAALKAHPAVFDAVVVGVPNERWGEQVAAVVEVRPDHSVTLEELDAHCRLHVAGYKVPRELHFVDKIERSAERQTRLPLGQDSRVGGALTSPGPSVVGGERCSGVPIRLHEVGAGEGLREEETLGRVAAEAAECGELHRRLDAFRNREEPECLRNTDRARDDGRVGGIGGDALDERLVDLQRVEREMLQVGE